LKLIALPARDDAETKQVQNVILFHRIGQQFSCVFIIASLSFCLKIWAALWGASWVYRLELP
jgi:hypothetical protein